MKYYGFKEYIKNLFHLTAILKESRPQVQMLGIIFEISKF